MTTAFYTAGNATVQSQRGMDVLANNISNISTTGYKGQQASFSDLMYTNMEGTSDNMKSGHGTRLVKTDTIFGVGNLNPTGGELDFALTDENSFFALRTQDGIQYTKAGNFKLSEQQDGQFYLVSSSGNPILDKNNNPIAVDPSNVKDCYDKIGVFKFNNVTGLSRADNTSFLPTPESGNPQVVEVPQLKQGFLETAKVDLADEMSEIIQSQRAFQFNTRMIQISDEIMQTLENIR